MMEFRERKRRTFKYDPETGVHFDDGDDDPVRDMRKQGNELFSEGNYTGAIKKYENALRSGQEREAKEKGSFAKGDEKMLHGNLSLCHLRMGNATLALSEADLCIAADAQWPKAHHRRAMALNALGRYSDAMHSIMTAGELAPYDKEIDEALRAAREKVYTLTPLLSEDFRAKWKHIPKEKAYTVDHTGRPAHGQMKYEWVRDIGNGQTCVLSARVDEGHASTNEATRTVSGSEGVGAGAAGKGEVQMNEVMHSFIYVGDPENWRILEDEEYMGPPSGKEGEGMSAFLGMAGSGYNDKSAKLREVLASLPWHGAYAGSPLLIREFQPLAVALLLRRWDWLSAEEINFLDRTGLAGAVEVHRKEGIQAAASTGGAASWVGLVPLLKASLYTPTNHIVLNGVMDGAYLPGEGTEEFEARARKEGASVPSLIYDSAHAWVSRSAPAAWATLEMVTCMCVRRQGVKLLLQVMHMGVTLTVDENIDEGSFVLYSAVPSSSQKKSEGMVAWVSPKKWKCFLPARGVQAALNLQEKGPMFSAVESGDSVTVGAMLRAWKLVHGDHTPFDEGGDSTHLAQGANFLHLGAQLGHLDVVKALVVEGGYDPSQRTSMGATPLILAAQNGHLDVLKFLVESGGSYLAQGRTGATPLHEAVTHNHLECVKFLAAQKDARYTFSMIGDAGTPLMLAVLYAREDHVLALIAAGCRVPEGPPPAQILNVLEGAPVQILRQTFVEAFYMMMLSFLSCIQGDAQRLYDTFSCLQHFKGCHKPPTDFTLASRLEEGQWEKFFPKSVLDARLGIVLETDQSTDVRRREAGHEEASGSARESASRRGSTSARGKSVAFENYSKPPSSSRGGRRTLLEVPVDGPVE